MSGIDTLMLGLTVYIGRRFHSNARKQRTYKTFPRLLFAYTIPLPRHCRGRSPQDAPNAGRNARSIAET